MKKLMMAALGAAVAAGCCCLCTGEKVRLAEDGKAKALIVIAKDASRAAQFGAMDLKWHLDKITGADFQIVTDDKLPCNPVTLQPCNPATPLLINVGFTKFTQAKPADFRKQQFLVDVHADGIDLVGLDQQENPAPKVNFNLDAEGRIDGLQSNWPDIYKPQCTMYAVYEFLENVVGARWLNPSDTGWALPSDADLAVPVTRVFTEPFLRFRGGTSIDNLGGYQSHVCNRPACRKIEFALSPDERTKPNLWRFQTRLFLLRHRAGGELAPANHSFYIWYDRFWQKNEKKPWLWEGERKLWFAQGYEGRPPQLCYTNPEVIAQAVKDGRDYFDNGGYPVYNKDGQVTGRKPTWGENQFCLEPMDTGSMCKCERCRKLMACDIGREWASESTYWFTFVNAVAKELKKSHPDKVVATLAYFNHEGLPQNVTLEDNVIVYFCLSCNRTMFGEPVEEHAQFKRMSEWRAAYPNQPLAFWLYNGFPDEHYRGMGIKGVPGFFAHEAEAQYRFFKKLNARAGVYHCGFDGDVDNYMQLEWMVNPDRTADEMLDDYFASYGETGRWLKKFYSLVEERYTTPGIAIKTAPLSQESCWGHMFPPEQFDKLTEYIEKARAAATDDRERKLAEVWRLAVYDHMKSGFDTYAVRKASPQPEWTAKRIAKAGGDLKNVDWAKLELIPCNTYFRGSTNVTPIRAEARCANDGEWLYVELTEYLDTSVMRNGPMIVPYDEVEVNLACQKASPYRQWFCAPNGRMKASSCQEVNFRWNVTDVEHGIPRFGANYESDVATPGRWRLRWAFPFDRMLNKRIEPGTDLYFNAVAVLNPDHITALKVENQAKSKKLLIAPLVTFTSVHSPDRAVTIHLEK